MREVLMLALMLILAGPMVAQDVAVAKGPEYEVVSVKPSAEQSGNSMIMGTPDGYKATGTTVKFMIMDAYGLKNLDLISGLPKWAADMRFDVETKMAPEMIEAQKKMTPKEKNAERRLMVQALLADRFKLQVRKEEKEQPAYAMVPAKGGFKLKPIDSSDPEKAGAKLPNGMRGGMLMMEPHAITGQMATMDALAQTVGVAVHRQVIDKSGAKGNYDFTIKYQPEDAPPATGTDALDPSLFTALEEQLGLKLESIKAMISSIAVGHIEQPGANQ